ncbi:MAG: transposase [Candidatus Aenigmarchaeota archaeon]|nr:transposase [Candidatus Aenigmarchaeota archaeon]
MSKKANKIVNFIDKTLSIKQNATWEASDYATLVSTAASHNTYLETVNSEEMPNADTLHYRIKEDVDISKLIDKFLSQTRKQLKNLKRKKVILIVDYTHESFFGKTEDEWIHGYRPVSGSKGSYTFLAASIIVGDKRYFIYAKPISTISDETFELMQILAQVSLLGFNTKLLLMDRGIAHSSENLAMLHDLNIKYLGLYQKYENIKKIIRQMKRSFINRAFKIKGVPTRLVIGKDIGKRKINWVFVTNLEQQDFFNYLLLYKKRWNIETGFRVQDEAQIKTKSTDIKIRFFVFLAALLLYNWWKLLRKQIAFKRFVIDIVRVWECVYKHSAKPT